MTSLCCYSQLDFIMEKPFFQISMISYRPTNFSWMLTTMCILGHEKVHIWPLSKSQKCPQSTIVTYMLICDQSRRTWRRWCFPWPEQLTCSSHTRVANLVGLATENINRTYSENHTKNNYLPRKPFKRGDGKSSRLTNLFLRFCFMMMSQAKLVFQTFLGALLLCISYK